MYKNKKKLVKTTVENTLKFKYIYEKKSTLLKNCKNKKETSFPLVNEETIITSNLKKTKKKLETWRELLIGNFIELFAGKFENKNYVNKNYQDCFIWELIIPFCYKNTVLTRLFVSTLQKQQHEFENEYNHPPKNSKESTSGTYTYRIGYVKKQVITKGSFLYKSLSCMHKHSYAFTKLTLMFKNSTKKNSSIVIESTPKTLKSIAEKLSLMFIFNLIGSTQLLSIEHKLFLNREMVSIANHFGTLCFANFQTNNPEIFLYLFTIDADTYEYLNEFSIKQHVISRILIYCTDDIIKVVFDQRFNCYMVILYFRTADSNIIGSFGNLKSVKIYCYMVNYLLEFSSYLDNRFLWLLVENAQFLDKLEKIEMSEKSSEENQRKKKIKLITKYHQSIKNNYLDYLSQK